MAGFRNLLLALAAAAVAFAPSAAAWAQDTPSWLLVVHGNVTGASAGKVALASGRLGVAFTDRPERSVRLIDIPAFVEAAWSEDGEFHSEPPNASLTDANEESTAVVEITDAAWVNDILQLEVNLLEGGVPETGDYVSLTIDSISTGLLGPY